MAAGWYDRIVRLRLALLVGISLSCATACVESNLFVVNVRSDWVPGQDVVRIFTQVDGRELDPTPVDFGTDLAGGLRVAELRDLEPGMHDVEVRLMGPDPVGLLAIRHARVNAGPGGSVTILVTRDCAAAVSCWRDDAASECVGGRCVSPECTPETPDACPETGCTADDECSSDVSCAERVCVTGACVPALVEGACAADEQCDPTRGCRPLGVTPLTRVGQIAAGFAHTCAMTQVTGYIYCWGSNAGGGLGRSEPGPFAAVEVFRADIFYLASGRHFSCLTEVGAQAICWGNNEAGELGRDTGGARGFARAAAGPPVVGPLQAGTSHVCARSYEGFLCWGRNDFGQANSDSAADPVLPTTLDLAAIELALGERHTCAIENGTGVVLCWGANDSGQLGDGTEVDRRTPAPVSGLTNATAIVATSNLEGAAGAATCAIADGGEVWCWGSNREGQLGSPTSAFSAVPLRVEGLPRADAIWAGATSFCARDGDETYCWGQNLHGELGLGTQTPFETTATRAPMLDRFSDLSLGHGFGCGTEDGHVYCWGDNGVGQVTGRENDPETALTPIEVALE